MHSIQTSSEKPFASITNGRHSMYCLMAEALWTREELCCRLFPYWKMNLTRGIDGNGKKRRKSSVKARLFSEGDRSWQI